MPLLRALPVLLVLLASTGVQAADRAEGAYQGARKLYYELKGSEEKQKLRHHWRNAGEAFHAVAKRFPKSSRAPDALFTAGQLFTDLSLISRLAEDLDDAIACLEALTTRHAKDSLADDGAVMLAGIYMERREQPEKAREVVDRVLEAQPKGDMAARLRALQDKLPAPRPPPAVAKAAPKPPRARPVAKAEPKPAPKEEPKEEARVARSEPEPRKAEPAPREEEAAPAPVLAERPETARPGASHHIPRAASAVVDAAESGWRQGRRASSLPPQVAAAVQEAPATAPVTSLESREALADAFRKAGLSPDAVPEGHAAARASAEEKHEGPGASLVAAVSRFAREDVPRAFEDAATRKAREEAARRRLKAAAELNRRAELTIAEQLGLKVRRVVIDAGHGGHDTGAIGKKGTREKDVALGISLKLAELLEAEGFEVILTRDDDRYLKLEERSRLANQARGDLFISIHCNAAVNRKAHGVETYSLNVSTDRYAIRLAARENAASEKGMSDLQYILADLATKANTEESSRLARHVQGSLVGQLGRKYSGIRNLGHKEALFYVLLGAKMPAILVETAFLSNATEEARLASGAYQEDVARAIAAGVQDFLGGRARVAKVQ